MTNSTLRQALITEIQNELSSQNLSFDSYFRNEETLTFLLDDEEFVCVIEDYNLNPYEHDKEIWIIFKVSNSCETTYYRVEGVHSSWIGLEWPHWESTVREVVPEQITLTIWK